MTSNQWDKKKLLLYLDSLTKTDLDTVHETFCLAYFLGMNHDMYEADLARVLNSTTVESIVDDVGPAMMETAAELLVLLEAKEVTID